MHLILDFFSTGFSSGAFDAFSAVIDVVSWEDKK
jgi:hypothetical protein